MAALGGAIFNFDFTPFTHNSTPNVPSKTPSTISSAPVDPSRTARHILPFRKGRATELTPEMSDTSDSELANYLAHLNIGDVSNQAADLGGLEELKTTPLFTWPVKEAAACLQASRIETFNQYALLGKELTSANRAPRASPQDSAVFLNTNAPWSAFICGSQGSGKSYTLSCILENCLFQSRKIGKMPKPLGGVLFYYDTHSTGAPCEAAYLATHIPVTVLVSPSNFWNMEKAYSKIPHVTVVPLLLKEKNLNTARMLRLMAFSDKDGSVPLYMEIIINILKQMAFESKGAPGLQYQAFLHRVNAESFARDQKGPMHLRLQLLESFMDTGNRAIKHPTKTADIFKVQPGSLTIVDLSDPFVDPASACVLFDICLALFLEERSDVGRIIALDEAHKFMNGSSASEVFTQSLLTVIREQRHKGARVVIATQEPTISTKLLDLCSMTIVHRFTSPEWLSTLKGHLAGASMAGGNNGADLHQLFKEIVNLNVGESLLFSPSAMLDVVNERSSSTDQTKTSRENIAKLGMAHVRFKTRPRLTADGGRSIMAT